MSQKELITEEALAHLAKKFREDAGKTRAQAAREMDVSQTSIFQAEEIPEQALVKLRTRMIEKFSPFKVTGPVFYVTGK